MADKLAYSTNIAASKEDLEAQASVEAAMAGTKLEKELLANAQAAKQQANVSKNLTKEERKKVVEISKSISKEAQRIAAMQKAGATQQQIDAEKSEIKGKSESGKSINTEKPIRPRHAKGRRCDEELDCQH